MFCFICLSAGCLPLRGTIPDMTSDSERYIQLQNIYQQQAANDMAVIRAKVHAYLEEIGRVRISQSTGKRLALVVLSFCSCSNSCFASNAFLSFFLFVVGLLLLFFFNYFSFIYLFILFGCAIVALHETLSFFFFFLFFIYF
jgi:hypothetical protein